MSARRVIRFSPEALQRYVNEAVAAREAILVAERDAEIAQLRADIAKKWAEIEAKFKAEILARIEDKIPAIEAEIQARIEAKIQAIEARMEAEIQAIEARMEAEITENMGQS
jgi:hypothetical protein